MVNKWHLRIAVTCFILGMSCIGQAVENANDYPLPIANEKFSGSQLNFTAKNDINNVTLTVIGPDGFYQKRFSKKHIPSMDLSEFKGLKDGIYNYEITAASREMMKNENRLDNGRGGNDRNQVNKSLQQSGHFRLANGKIMAFEQIEEPPPSR